MPVKPPLHGKHKLIPFCCSPRSNIICIGKLKLVPLFIPSWSASAVVNNVIMVNRHICFVRRDLNLSATRCWRVTVARHSAVLTHWLARAGNGSIHCERRFVIGSGLQKWLKTRVSNEMSAYTKASVTYGFTGIQWIIQVNCEIRYCQHEQSIPCPCNLNLLLHFFPYAAIWSWRNLMTSFIQLLNSPWRQRSFDA